jgi:malonyl-CoA O-methyltransferase
MQSPQSATPAGTSSAHKLQRGTGRANRATQSPQTRCDPQPWQTAHRLANRPAAAGAKALNRRVKGTGSIYCPPMSDHATANPRRLDAVAVHAALRRLLRAPAPPWLHAEVARRMAERLAVIRLKPALLFDWWAHLGASADVLVQACPQAQRFAVEPTPAALARSQASSQHAAALSTSGELPPGAQLIWANMMLHWVPEPPRLIERWHRLLAVDGFVMFSCLGPGTLRELRALYTRLGWPAPTPDFIDMHDLGDMLVQAGFADPVMDQETLSLQWDSADALLAELRTLGGNAAPDRWPGLRTPRWRERLLRELVSMRGADGRISLSVEVAYGHAFKAAPRLLVGEETTLSLEAMRTMLRSDGIRR